MDKQQLQPALREWRNHMCDPRILLVCVALSVFLAIIVPFGAAHEMPAIGRFGYWLLTVVATYCAGALINGLASHMLRPRLSLSAVIGLSCIAAGIAISALVTAINFFAIGQLPTLGTLPLYLGSIFIIAFIIAGLFHVLSKPNERAHTLPATILDRMPYDKRGRLMVLSVEDHYVRNTTTKGAGFVLLRLSDAMRETGDVAGLQVHPSHWIALSAVKTARRDGDRAILTIISGDDIPVSRRYMPDIKEAGLLARS